MSQASIKAALETAIKTALPTTTFAWENVRYIPPADGSYYIAVFLLPATPENPTFGDSFVRHVGLIQLSLSYPIGAGSGKAYQKADEIAAVFHRGASFVSGGITVVISGTPSIGPQIPKQGDRYMLPVRIRYFANVMQ